MFHHRSSSECDTDSWRRLCCCWRRRRRQRLWSRDGARDWREQWAQTTQRALNDDAGREGRRGTPHTDRDGRHSRWLNGRAGELSGKAATSTDRARRCSDGDSGCSARSATSVAAASGLGVSVDARVRVSLLCAARQWLRWCGDADCEPFRWSVIGRQIRTGVHTGPRDRSFTLFPDACSKRLQACTRHLACLHFLPRFSTS